MFTDTCIRMLCHHHLQKVKKNSLSNVIIQWFNLKREFLTVRNKTCEIYGISLNPGTTALVSTGRCEKLYCKKNLSVSILGCGIPDIDDPSCKEFEHDHSKPFPDCCNTFICVDKVMDPHQTTVDNRSEIVANTLD